MLVRLIYASHTQDAISGKLIDDILAQSQTRNPANGITGLLCYSQNTFVQVLEGGRAEVNKLFQLLAQDKRHQDVTLLKYEEITERRYANWAMARVALDKLNMSLLLRYSDQARLDPFSVSGESTARLLEALAEAGALCSRD
ncbi:MAG: BLUF domain-containing protein [Paludibacterium sp.]|uniref:BLUF domain-containing protein n=1 Tax=Paludibacterium sp. TaxID=1917523 RepID=UPI0025EFB70E|nr:BLUF domain-containing protein [Paludibacterium sp.]MBV8049256.1 BLUF domain-containing protein [Paludibacterium sp.]MBV8648270.1 BLUF domain-containing protein [Paludibacterium sp.]